MTGTTSRRCVSRATSVCIKRRGRTRRKHTNSVSVIDLTNGLLDIQDDNPRTVFFFEGASSSEIHQTNIEMGMEILKFWFFRWDIISYRDKRMR